MASEGNDIMSSHPSEVPNDYTLTVGQDVRGRWLVQDADGLIEGFFQSQASALGFARSESEIYHARVELSAKPLVSHLLH
jgi:hypothetical protein